MRRTVPRKTLKAVMKRHQPHLRLGGNTDLLVHLNFLLFLHRLAEETRTMAIAEKSKTIKYEHVLSSAKTICHKDKENLWTSKYFGLQIILKKSRG